MGNFQYEWWNIDIKFSNGTYTMEFKGKDQEHVKKQILKYVDKNNKDPYTAPVVEIFWNSMVLDRKGYARRF